MRKQRKVLSVRTKGRVIKIPASLTVDEWSLFQSRAEHEGRSVTGQVSWLIREHLREYGSTQNLNPRKIWIHKAPSAKAAGEFDAEYYLKMSPEQRLETMCFLRKTQGKIHGAHGNK